MNFKERQDLRLRRIVQVEAVHEAIRNIKLKEENLSREQLADRRTKALSRHWARG